MSARYQSDRAGMRAFMNSQMVGDAVLGVAQDLAGEANRRGNGGYEAQRRTVQAGKYATNRAGAEVVETERHFSDVRQRLLVNLSRQYRTRGGG